MKPVDSQAKQPVASAVISHSTASEKRLARSSEWCWEERSDDAMRRRLGGGILTTRSNNRRPREPEVEVERSSGLISS